MLQVRPAFICIFLFFSPLSHTQNSSNISSSYTSNKTYTVSYIYDGDTVKLRELEAYDSADELKLRLTDIDAPERNQAFGLKARRALIKLCYGKNIIATVKLSGTDKYNRALGRLRCNNIDASLYLAERGLAWHYAQYSSDVEIYKAAQNARRLTLGLWADDNPIPPWVWRHQHLY
ncbi:MAG: hypothetical protein RIS87_957 [Pseudomonadota bacterium]|jgi:micrococcal nuclease